MILFSEYLRKINEEILRQISFMNAVARAGVPQNVLNQAHKAMTINDFLENTPPEAHGAYALGISSGGSGMKGIYFNIVQSLNLTQWPSAYAKAFGKNWAQQINDPQITDKFLDYITNDSKYIVFFLPNNALASTAERRYTREEVEYFIRNPEKLKKVIFVLGTYDLVDPEDYDKLIAANRNKQQRQKLSADVLKNPQLHRKPGEPI